MATTPAPVPNAQHALTRRRAKRQGKRIVEIKNTTSIQPEDGSVMEPTEGMLGTPTASEVLHKIMSPRRLYPAILTVGLLFSVAPAAFSQDKTQPDTTTVNKRDRSPSESTADQGKNNLSDWQITQNIRKAVIADKSLSTYGHNAKIIADHGKVTLKGQVHSEEESKTSKRKQRKLPERGMSRTGSR